MDDGWNKKKYHNLFSGLKLFTWREHWAGSFSSLKLHSPAGQSLLTKGWIHLISMSPSCGEPMAAVGIWAYVRRNWW